MCGTITGTHKMLERGKAEVILLGRTTKPGPNLRSAIFDRTGWTVALALAVLLGAVVSYGVTGSFHARPVSLKDSCGADVLFFGARGSGEKPDDASLGFGA